jgi:hypothetical protein
MLVVLRLLLLLVSHYRGAALIHMPAARVLRRVLHTLVAIGARPPPLVAQSVRDIPVSPAQVHRLAPVGRGLLIAAPVVVFFGALLMAADIVFASYVQDIWRCSKACLAPQLANLSAVYRPKARRSRWSCRGPRFSGWAVLKR